MNTQPDFEALLRLLEEVEVEYLIVGGYAVAWHGFVRFTKDLDLFFRNSNQNGELLRQALVRFGFPSESIPLELFTTEGNIITFGVEPIRIDLMNQIDGVSFDEAWRGRVRGSYGEVAGVNFIGKDELLLNKSSTNRMKDRMDFEELS